MAKQNEILTLRNIESGHTEKLTKEEWENIQPSMKEKYEITNRERVAIPSEIIEK